MDRFQPPRGTRDFLPAEMFVRNRVESIVRSTFESYGFQQVQTPIFEQYKLLAARAGEEIQKTMFTFLPEEGLYALRPELTSPVCRLVTSNALSTVCRPYKLYYFGPCFRYFPVQEERFSEFYHAGIELMGSESPLADAEVIAVAVKTLKRLGIGEFQLRVGTVGVIQKLLEEHLGSDDHLHQFQSRVVNDIDRILHVRENCAELAKHQELNKDDQSYLDAVATTLQKLQTDIGYDGEFKLQPDCREAPGKLVQAAEAIYKASWVAQRILPKEKADLIVNVSRIRGSRDEALGEAEELLLGTGALTSFVHLSHVCDWLPILGVQDFEVVMGMARSLDFYTGTVFEIDSAVLGAQQQICGGGRYDDLVWEFGGPRTPATGFAFYFDRLVHAYEQASTRSSRHVEASAVDVVVISAVSSQECRREAIALAELLRDGEQPLRVGVDLMELGKHGQVMYSHALKAPLIVFVGDSSNGKCMLQQGTHEPSTIEIASLKERIQNILVQAKKEAAK